MNDLISREAAIDDIETVNPSMPLNVNWVKNWVKTLPSAQPEVTKEDVELYCRQRCLTVVTNELFNEMKARWSAQPEQKTGKWIKIDDNLISGKCSQCGWEAHLYEDDVFGMDYCPNCGAKMEVEE